jgi:hypothetical protein
VNEIFTVDTLSLKQYIGPSSSGTPSSQEDDANAVQHLWPLVSHVYGGIHFQFDSDASQLACPKVADYVHANYMMER